MQNNRRRDREIAIAGLLIVLLLGVYFRWVNLADRVYWVDEVATSIRIAGTTRTQLTQTLATGQLLTVQQLLDVQQLAPTLPWSATFAALRQSPEHAPLYFLLARLWLQLVGNGIAQIRSLSVLFSLLSLPALFWLCLELFQARRTGWIAVSLLAVSPFFVAYAQEARPYSLWGLTLLLLGATLLRAIRTAQARDWLLYSLCAAIALYTSVLTGLVLAGQGIYAAMIGRSQKAGVLQRWIGAAVAAILLFMPWIIVIVQQWETLQDNTTWARIPLSPIAMGAIWLYSLVVLFFDLPVSTALTGETIAKASTALLILAIVGLSLHSLRCASKSAWIFLLTFALPIPIVLLLIDWMAQGQASATPRYLLPLQLAVLLSISRWLHPALPEVSVQNSRPFERAISRARPAVLLLLLSFSLMSCLSNLNRIPDYQKAHNRFNPPIAALINGANRPLILSDAANTMNLLSLSHSLLPALPLRIFPAIDPAFSDPVVSLDACNTTFLFNPPADWIDRLSANRSLILQEIYQPELLTSDDIHLSLWTIEARDMQNESMQNRNGCGQEPAR